MNADNGMNPIQFPFGKRNAHNRVDDTTLNLCEKVVLTAISNGESMASYAARSGEKSVTVRRWLLVCRKRFGVNSNAELLTLLKSKGLLETE